MTTPYIMPLGFVDRKTEAGTVFLLTNPRESKSLRPYTPVAVWTYSPAHLALGKVRGRITAVGYTTATFSAVETSLDTRWPQDQDVLRPKAPVFLAKEGSFEPDLSRMLTPEQAEEIQRLAGRYREITRSNEMGHPELDNTPNPERL